MHECLCKTHSRDCPHGEVAFSNSNINKKQCTIKICQITSFMSTMGKWHLMISFHHSRQIYYGEMIHYDFISPWWIITYCNLTTNLLWWNDTLWFHFTIVDYYILQFDKFLSYKDIRRKAFFTMATLLMLLLENVRSHSTQALVIIYLWEVTKLALLHRLYLSFGPADSYCEFLIRLDIWIENSCAVKKFSLAYKELDAFKKKNEGEELVFHSKGGLYESYLCV